MKKITLLLAMVFGLFASQISNAQVVTSGADDGSDGTLRVEIADTPAGGEITFSAAVLTVALNNELTIDKELTITGSPVINTIIDADGNGRAFNITAGPVTFTNLDIINGDAEDGGGIFVAGADLTIDDCGISNNIASGASGSGGGIFVDAGATLTATDTEISGNQANRAGGGIEDNSGAGVAITLDNVNLDNNNAGVAPATASPGNGGGLHITGAGDAMIIGGTVNDNVAAAEGGGLWNGSGMMTIDATEIDANTASGDDADQGGGGVYNLSGIIEIVNGAVISNNNADGASGSGGGILNDAGGMLTINDASITGNTSNRAGGGIEDVSGAVTTIIINGATLSNNETFTSPGNGGGLHITGDGNANILNATVTDNIAGSEGGGLWNSLGTMTVDNTLIDGNSATGANADNGGGGIFNNGGTLVVQNNTILSNNLATGTSGSGGGLLSVDGAVTINESVFDTNSANRAGGAIELIDGTLDIDLSELTANDVNGTAGTANPGNGGAFHVTGESSVITIDRSDINANLAANEGGALWNQLGTQLIVSRTTFENNSAAGTGGGALYNNGGSYIIITSTLSNNSATAGAGGAIHNDFGTFDLERSTLSGNTAATDGGGIFNNDTFAVNALTIALNTATDNGGGIFSVTNTALKNTIVSGNTAASGLDVDGNFSSTGFNIIGTDDTNAFPEEATDQEEVTPLLGPLQDNGGDTFTHALQTGSVGIDEGDPADVFKDQRDFSLVGTRDIGAFELDGVFGVNDVVTIQNSIIYPNPARSNLTVELPNDVLGPKKMTIVSITGQTVKERELTSGINEFSLYGLTSGMYIVRVETEGLITSHKLVVE